ncbi:uncharacterized protein SPPG_09202 [Spizellomyces punctatus DAOM BR117]|uniref:Uncharacterized protein n=1 Tax=Spizellomyces punctatus (strain DAOM BR117) TaxID=645134 RepID=A0A0L0HHD4_SPIPD|nr:uncharacterized protein SPPG_09202 [Spizellomyces punctatus DAOM BR117]KND00204.1 hypothetical protein SPPG_09202 [Spizellomyces punctatus DAOM BR117]|eukprot:XP_016608243.1 hypothetical protein SPPG_09202 [Spizellomyces punctatus DAOM BR117]
MSHNLVYLYSRKCPESGWVYPMANLGNVVYHHSEEPEEDVRIADIKQRSEISAKRRPTIHWTYSNAVVFSFPLDLCDYVTIGIYHFLRPLKRGPQIFSVLQVHITATTPIPKEANILNSERRCVWPVETDVGWMGWGRRRDC